MFDTPKGSKNSEAVAAAMRAFAGSSASKIPRKSPSGSGATTRRGSNNQLESMRKESSAHRTTSRDLRGSRHERAGSGEMKHIMTLQSKRDVLGINVSARSSTVSVLERRASDDSADSA